MYFALTFALVPSQNSILQIVIILLGLFNVGLLLTLISYPVKASYLWLQNILSLPMPVLSPELAIFNLFKSKH